MLKTRLKTAAVLIVIVIALLCVSHIPYVMNAFIALLSSFAVYELYKATDNLKKYVPFVISLLIAVVFPFIAIPYYVPFITVLLVVAITVFLLMMKYYGKYDLNATYKAFLLSLLPPIFYSSFISLRLLENGIYFILLFAIVCAVTDSGAYFVGRAIGKKKLAPLVSPKKTIEGSIGGSLSAVIILLLLGLVVDLTTNLSVNYIALGVYALIASVIDQIGDLSMSVIKRTVGIKDYSNLMPGHGGVLDRFDSYMFVAPFTLIFYTFINHIIY